VLVVAVTEESESSRVFFLKEELREERRDKAPEMKVQPLTIGEPGKKRGLLPDWG
jgi:hypothetical protein